MNLKRITVCLLALMICLQTPMSALAADEVSGSTQVGSQQEEAAVEEKTIEEKTIEENNTEENSIEKNGIEENIEETAEEIFDEPVYEGEVPEIIRDSEQEEIRPAPETLVTETAKEQSIDEEELTEIIESDPVIATEQKTPANAESQTTWTVSGWHKVGTSTYYVKKDLTLARGITKIGNVKYLFNKTTGELMTGLVTINGATYLADSNGKMLTGWRTVNKKRYYFTDKHYSEYKEENEGKRLSGFIYVSGNRYYLMNDKMEGYKEANFAVRVTGWATVKGYTYYMDPKTGIVATGFQTVDGKRYYFNGTGSRQLYTGWRTVEGKRYYFNSDYSVQRGMSTIDGFRYYLDSETGEVICGWKTINGRKYYFADERYRSYNISIRGQRLTGFKEISGKTYYFITSSMAGYNKADYASRATGFRTINGKVYHFETNGVMDTGWRTIDGAVYHFTSKGVMDDGWTVIDHKTYYFSDGKMVTGWKTVDKKLYYFHKDGHKQECGRVVISGKTCAFDINGVCRSKNSTIHDVVEYALKWNGRIPYKSSVTNSDPNEERKNELKAGQGTDCSWFVFHCLARYGYLSEFVHSYEWGSKPSLYKNGKDIGKNISNARPGDIICYAYGTPRTSKNSHVSIYIGGGKEIHCANGNGVIISTVTKKDIISIVRFSN